MWANAQRDGCPALPNELVFVLMYLDVDDSSWVFTRYSLGIYLDKYLAGIYVDVFTFPLVKHFMISDVTDKA